MKKLTSARREILKRMGQGDVLYTLPESSGIRHAKLHHRDHNSSNLRIVKFETLTGLVDDGWIVRKDDGPDARRFEFVMTEKASARYGYGNGRVAAKTRIVADRQYFVVYLEPKPPEVAQLPVQEAVESPNVESLEESVRKRLKP